MKQLTDPAEGQICMETGIKVLHQWRDIVISLANRFLEWRVVAVSFFSAAT